MKKPLHMLGGVLLLLLLAPAVLAQGDMETFVSDQYGVGFMHPAGWAIEENDSGILAGEGAFQMLFFNPELLSLLLSEAQGLEDAIESIAEVLEVPIEGDIESADLEGRTAAFASIQLNETLPGRLYGIELADGTYGVILASSMDIENDAEIMDAVVGSYDLASEFDAEPVSTATSDSDTDTDSDKVSSLSDFDAEWPDAIAELEEVGILGSGGSLVFQENRAFFTGQGNFFTALARTSPFTDIVMAGELSFTIGDRNTTETCTLLSRIQTNARGDAERFLEIGLQNTGVAYFQDRFSTTQNSTLGLIAEDVDLSEPHHFLIIAQDDTLTVYIDGELMLDSAEIDERSGTYGIALRGGGRDARCEGDNIWVYQAPKFEPGVCEISAGNTVNRRSGPGTDFDRDGTMAAGSTQRAVAQAEDSSGYTWYKLDDDAWVREDVITAVGDCAGLPVEE